MFLQMQPFNAHLLFDLIWHQLLLPACFARLLPILPSSKNFYPSQKLFFRAEIMWKLTWECSFSSSAALFFWAQKWKLGKNIVLNLGREQGLFSKRAFISYVHNSPSKVGSQSNFRLHLNPKTMLFGSLDSDWEIWDKLTNLTREIDT